MTFPNFRITAKSPTLAKTLPATKPPIVQAATLSTEGLKSAYLLPSLNSMLLNIAAIFSLISGNLSMSRAGYFDLHSLFQVGKVLLGKKDRTIKGNITLDSNILNLSLQMPDEAATPQYLVYYYLDRQQFS